MSESNRKFKGVWIPSQLWLDTSMSFIEKLLLVEIDSLDNENGCTAGNPYFAKFFQISERQVRRYIARLQELGWVKIDLIGRNKRCVYVLEKYLVLVDNLKPLMDINVRQVGQKRPSADGQKRPHNKLVNKLRISSEENLKKIGEMKKRAFGSKVMAGATSQA